MTVPKTIFGQTGNFTGEEVLDLICAKPECAPFIAAKLWRFFVQDEPPRRSSTALAAEFHAHGMDLKQLMGVIFRSKEFYAPEVIRSQIKSPVQWLIAGTHQLEAPLPTQPMTLVMLRQLGQELFQPPNVKGWDGGIAWITTNNLLDRYNFAAALVEGDRVPLPSLRGQMRSLMNTDGGGRPDADRARAGVDALHPDRPERLRELFLAALQARFLNADAQAAAARFAAAISSKPARPSRKPTSARPSASS